ncbi:hypothetical protein [Roseovarius aestuarii]|uniref:Uncharacterized protein n=1 Tax=Roseovarius aestuarii TaxID=475083 RepID=A0A1X7BXZ2_9RHOB|nr:hypothetical protein [Roseovarius aestuarii]SMC14395.1 hypothetical protein ROA7745_04262 [Roseovarius aestuarii]
MSIEKSRLGIENFDANLFPSVECERSCKKFPYDQSLYSQKWKVRDGSCSVNSSDSSRARPVDFPVCWFFLLLIFPRMGAVLTRRSVKSDIRLALIATASRIRCRQVSKDFWQRRFIYDGKVKSLKRRHLTRSEFTSDDLMAKPLTDEEIGNLTADLTKEKDKVR